MTASREQALNQNDRQGDKEAHMSEETPRLPDLSFLTTRRGLLKGALLGAGVIALPGGLAACGGNDNKGATGGSSSAKSTELEVFSWWTGGGEAAGLDALIKIWNQKYPDIKFTNAAVAGGAGSNAKAVLAQRLSAGDPPDSFQAHAGAETTDYVVKNQLLPINDLYDQWGLKDVFPSDLVSQITVNGNVYSVPVNIHRANVMWWNPKVVQDAGITSTPTSLDEWFAALDKVKAKGNATPLSVAEQWTNEQLMETVLIATLGTDGWAKLWTKDGDWKSSQVTDALNSYKRLLTYVNKNFASLTWQDASKMVVDGKAAYNVMGDWAAGYFIELKKTAKTDYDWDAVPGTGGVYDWLSDSFTKPKGAKHLDATDKWLELVSSKDGQDAFNPLKGSIPARKDADASLYKDYLAWALEEWKKDKLAGSLAHGVVAGTAWNTELQGALGIFLTDRNVSKFQDALAKAHDTYATA